MLGIGDYDRVNRRKIITREGQVLYMGHKYSRDPRTGYYTCTSGRARTRLHVAMWQHEAGRRVPPGCVVHHLDWDKSNNIIDNFVCLTVEEHNRVHNVVGGEKGKALGYKIKEERGLGVPPGYDMNE